jgi:cysteine dioxygenase
MNISEFLDQLDAASQPISLESLKGWLGQLELEPEHVSDFLNFENDKYQRNLLRRTANYEALLLCFEAGQRTPIHDHSGSACGVKVIQGAGIETSFKSSADGWLFATGSTELPQGGVVGSQDMDIHQLSNLQIDGRRLVTLHIYSPPLGEVGNYCIEDNSVKQVNASVRETTAH